MKQWTIIIQRGTDLDPGLVGYRYTVTDVLTESLDLVSRIDFPDTEIWLDPTQTLLVMEMLKGIKAINGKQVEMRHPLTEQYEET